MATNFIVDPTRFYAEGAIVDWVRSARLLGIQAVDPQQLQPSIELRWMVRGDLGMPTEPFKVWARAHSSQGIERNLQLDFRLLVFMGAFTAVSWPAQGTMSNVSIDLAPGSIGTISGFAGAPSFENINTILPIPAGATTVVLAAPVLDGLLIPPTAAVTAVRGIEVQALSQAAGWVLIETVGLPVKRREWNIDQHGVDQGLAGAFTEAQTAAIGRLKRGAPPFGWSPLIDGRPAPPWAAPDFGDLVGEVNKSLLDFLKNVLATKPPNQQIGERIDLPMPPPQNSAGASVSATSSNSKVSPFGMTLLGASSDPFVNLVLGFGTAYALPDFFPATVNLQRLTDFMVTAHWEKGLDGRSAPVDFAAIVPAPGLAAAPPPAANLSATSVALLKPIQPDAAWRCTSLISWDKTPNAQLFRSASFAAARLPISPTGPVEAMMDPRPSGGFRPIAINTTDPARDPLWWRNSVMDRELPISPSPGSRVLAYGAAVQDIYGQWSPWQTVNEFIQQPDLDPVRIVSARLKPVPTAAGSLCPATLEVEFLWDWSVRTPQRLQFAGLLYPAAEHGSPPPSIGVPGGLARTVGGAEPPLEVTFAGNVPFAPGTVFAGLDGGGENNVGFGPAQGAEGRRYRMTVSGLSLDFAFSGHIGLALWARGQEKIAPARMSAWSERPLLATTSDPRPPVVPVFHVKLASLPDAAGQSHARIAWAAQPGATGYFIYESDETQILQALGLPEPVPTQTLDDRLKVVRDRFAAIPRRVYTRLNSTKFAGTDRDIALPKGSRAIHFYIVIGISAGQVEGNWPTDPDQHLAVVAPHIMTPTAPTLEVQRVLDRTAEPPVYRAKLFIHTRPGPRVKKIDLHRVRVDDAARELDTMGPPVARIQTSGGDWMVTTAADADATSFIQSAAGIDTPPGSWRRVWYRAAAWTETDPTRGGLPGRSRGSTAAWVVLPPPDAPVLSPLATGSGATPAEILIEWTSTAPIKRTPLGPHTLSARAALPGAPPQATPLLSVDLPLDKLPRTQPASGSGVWIVETLAGVTRYRALIRRAALTDPVRFLVRIADPLARLGEALASFPGGAIDPAPDLEQIQLRRTVFPPPARLVLQFVSSVPIAAPLDGAYRLRVTAVPAIGIPMTMEMPVSAITATHGGLFLPLGLHRFAGAGPQVTYVAVTTAAVQRFIIRMTVPDGRFVEKTQNVV